ncbi:MAG: phosphatidylserine decarboxylase family protein [Desulfohalobiaceae bacterium]
MKKPSTGLCPEGLPYIFLAGLTTLTLALLGSGLLALAALVLTALIFNFFRDPERVVPQEPGVAVSGADGKVVLVDEHPDPLTGLPRQRVCVFMNVFNVHVNRCPVGATVTAMRYFPGRFLNASLDKASEHNERNVLVLEESDGHSWTMVQIAGLVARRIVSWAETGDGLERGQRLGLIKFGSRVDLYLPDDYFPTVAVGEKVLAGQTIVARSKALS